MQTITTSAGTGNRKVMRGILIKEGGFTVKNMTSDEEKIKAYRLRHRIFAEELRWVATSESMLEKDSYDCHAVSIGVFDDRNRLVGLARLIRPQARFMIEKEFSIMVGSWHTIRKQSDTAEASRLCVLPEARNTSVQGNFGIHNVSMFLYKGIYQWCARNNIRYIYVVVETKIHRMFMARGFPCRLAGEPVTMADGCTAVAATIDFEELVRINRVKRPAFTQWFTQYQSSQVQVQRRRPGFYSPPQVSA